MQRGLAGLASLTLLGGLAACSDDEKGEPVEPFAVELSPEGVPQDLKIGVVVTLGGDTDEGSQWREAAEGAEVAAYRYDMGDVAVDIVPRDDRGTDEGVDAAVEELVDEGVAGIVMATSGDHVAAGIDRAVASDVPVLLPYASDLADTPNGVWTTGPGQDQVDAALADGMTSAEVSSPVLVDAGGGTPDGMDPVTTLRFGGGDATSTGARVARQLGQDGAADSVVITGPAELQASVVQAVQARGADVPMFLSADATSPRFATALTEGDGSLTSSMTSGGLANGDPQALASGDDGAALSAYLAGVRATAEDPETTDFFDGEAFSTVAGVADVASHDAVVSLVTAAADAGSADPGEVGDALGSLTVEQGDGLGGPPLDFSSSAALDEGEVVPLQATPQDPGLRTIDPNTPARLFWFALPGS